MRKVFRLGRDANSFLADHGFHGLAVVPGACYFDLALRALGDAGLASVIRIVGAEFRQPVILSDDGADVALAIERRDGSRARCTFREVRGASAEPDLGATFEIEPADANALAAASPVGVPAAFLEKADATIDDATFYARLNESGNRYGPRFQGLRRLWRSGVEAWARLSRPGKTEGEGDFALDPIAVDSAIQALMVFGLDRGRTMVLRAIDAVTFRPRTVGGDGWVSVRMRPTATANELVGDIDVHDDAGACWLELRGVRLTLHDRDRTATTTAAAVTNVVVAATFTAEPIEDVLRFWSDTLDLRTHRNFAPYNQVFQQLLDSQSQFHRNRDGANLILLNLADWAADEPAGAAQLKLARPSEAFCDLATATLPNGLTIAHLNPHETDYVYREIFEDRCYLRHGVHLPEAATVIDIGANIGLFSLFVRRESPGATVFAYEPSPAAFRALQANCAAYGPGLQPFNVGVAEHRGEAALAFYEKSSVFSNFHPNADDDRAAIRAVVTNVVRSAARDAVAVDDGLIDELLADRLDGQVIACPLVSVSDIIRENRLHRIDLLKIDAEKCEVEILRGIADAEWGTIEQVVVEVHDRTGARVREVREILTQRGFRCVVAEEDLLTGSGLCNVYATRARNDATAGTTDHRIARLARNVQRTADEFVGALEAFARAANGPTFLAICPSDGETSPGGALAPALVPIERALLRRARALPQVHAVGSEEILARYPTAEFHDSHARELGHIPYTAEGFAAVGTSLFRMFAGLRRAPFKVIALDCDHTLWQGTCGEAGPAGVVVTPAFRALQEFMLRQRDAGRLLCLCSKNQEADVWSVFGLNPDMILRREHLAAVRINWAPKSDNLRSLAAELNVGVDSIILLDDSPLENAEVRARCPEVLALTLPAEAAQIPRFLDHLWAFDQGAVTAEDRARARRMAESDQREKSRAVAPTLQEFIAGLELRVEIFAPDAGRLGRVAQLTQRTNQFNFTTVRRTESDVRRFLENENHRALIVDATDRFGDYGTVGVLLYAERGDGWCLDTFLLSCRALGRGVEHRVLAEFGRRAAAAGRSWIECRFRRTEKNQPAEDFLVSLGARAVRADGAEMVHRFSASELAGLQFKPGSQNPGQAPTIPGESGAAGAPGLAPAARTHAFETFARIARELDDAHKIAAAAEAHGSGKTGSDATPANHDLPDTLGGKLLGIWRRVLGHPRLSVDDRFMEAGGTSLKAVQIVAAIRKELHVPVSVVAFFESPTVRLLSEKLSPGNKPRPAATEAMARGARRRAATRAETGASVGAGGAANRGMRTPP